MSRSLIEVVFIVASNFVLLMAPFSDAESRNANFRVRLKCEPAVSEKTVRTIATSIDGRVGVFAELIETGETVGWNSSNRFPMQSVYKLPIAMATLQAVDQGRLKLNSEIVVTRTDFVTPGQHSPLRDANPNGARVTVERLLSLMVSESDGTACDVLLRILGGAAKVNAYLKSLGVNEVVVKTTEKAMGMNEMVQYQNWATPTSLVKLLHLLQQGHGLSSDSRARLLTWMISSPTGPGRLKAELPPGTEVAHKTGSSGTRNGLTRATNDIGIIQLTDGRHVAIAVLVSDAKAEEKTRDGVIAKIGRTVYDCWSA